MLRIAGIPVTRYRYRYRYRYRSTKILAVDPDSSSLTAGTLESR